MSLLTFAILFTAVGIPFLVFAGLKKSKGFSEGAAGGIGAGLGISWRKAMGFDDISIAYDILFITAGVILAFGLVRILRTKE